MTHLLREKKFKRQRPAWPLLTGLALLVFAAVSCSGAAGEGFQSESGGAGPGGEQAALDLEHPSLGDENAPVVLTE